MNDIILAPENGQIERFLSSQLTRPFADPTLDFINSLSTYLLDTCRTDHPDLYALAYWFRAAHIQKIQDQFTHRHGDFLSNPKGTIFQISPGNVDTLFLYSGLLGLLMGNRLAIRISSKQTEQLGFLISTLNSLLNEERFSSVKQRLFIFSSDHDSLLIKSLSAECDLRVLWGSDDSVRAIRKIELSARAKDLSFPERVSCSLISAEQVNKTEDIRLLVSAFVKDINGFSQQACSSPKCLIWQGSDIEITAAKQKFWREVDEFSEQLNVDKSLSELMAKKVSLQKMAAAYPIRNINEYRMISRADVDMNQLDMFLLKMNAGHGVILESDIKNLSDLSAYLSEHYQTLSYWGYERDKLLKKIANKEDVLLNFDRVELIGQALDFHYIWDGYDLLHEFCRLIKK